METTETKPEAPKVKVSVVYDTRPEEELRKIAEDLWAGAIFTDRHIRKGDENLTSMIFMPLMFMDEATVLDMRVRGASVAYEYLSEAGRAGINGYPIFMSVRWLNETEAERVDYYFNKFKAAYEAVKAESVPSTT